MTMMKACRSSNIIEYYSALIIPGTSRLIVAMELMALSVADLICPEYGGSPLPESCIAYVLRETLNALVYLHAEHRIHRDIKASNLLLSAEGLVKVADFGVAAQLGAIIGMKRKTFVGTPLWMAPEVIRQNPDVGGITKERSNSSVGSEPNSPGGDVGDASVTDGYGEAADIWSLGITAIEVIVIGLLRFHGAMPAANTTISIF